MIETEVCGQKLLVEEEKNRVEERYTGKYDQNPCDRYPDHLSSVYGDKLPLGDNQLFACLCSQEQALSFPRDAKPCTGCRMKSPVFPN